MQPRSIKTKPFDYFVLIILNMGYFFFLDLYIFLNSFKKKFVQLIFKSKKTNK